VSLEYIESLPLLNLLSTRIKENGPSQDAWKNVLIVGNQHLLPSTCALVGSILGLGVLPKNIILTGKIYSCRPSVVQWLRQKNVTVFSSTESPIQPGEVVERHRGDLQALWQNVQARSATETWERIIILDDGGYGTLAMPAEIFSIAPVIVIEQTTSGIKVGNRPELRRINVAMCCSKLRLESPIIAKAIVQALTTVLPKINGPIGIVGFGNIGRELAFRLDKMGHEVFFFDWRSEELQGSSRINALPSLRSLCEKCASIIGCTGEDIFNGVNWLDTLGKDLTLISASSQDIEFRSILKSASQIPVTPGSSVEVFRGNSRYQILFSGFPINFIGDSEIEDPKDIQLTRALLLSAIFQAVICRDNQHTVTWPASEKLNESLQQFIVLAWFKMTGISIGENTHFGSLEWIREHSGGVTNSCVDLSTAFHD
jgi:hypothetical protein